MALEKNPKFTGLVYEVGENPREKKKVGRIAVWNNLSMKEKSPVYQGEIQTDSGKRYRFGLWNFKPKEGGL